MSAKNTVKKLTLCIASAFGGGVLALSLQAVADNKKDSLPVQDIRNFVEVYDYIKNGYYKETEDSQLISDAVKGMVQGLDPHSEYMSKEDFVDLKESSSGEFGGLGIEISKKNDSIVIIAPIEDTPAEKAGLQSGDYIIKINGESTRGMSTMEAVKKMRGKAGTPIDLTISRANSSTPIQVHIVRATIKVKSVRSKLFDDGYAYVKVSQFQQRTTEDLVSHINNLYKQNKSPLKGIVLDLRDDPGGLLNQAVGVSAVFLPKESLVVSTKGRNGKKLTEYKATRSDYMPGKSAGKDILSGLPENIKDVPVVVLINSGSASASEIVTGALQDHKRAVVVGVQSFGKGSVQSVVPLSNGAGVKLTVSLYYTPNNRSIQAQGIVPDIELKSKNDDYQVREADLGGHLDNPFGGEETKGQIDDESANKKKAEIEKNKNKTEDERFAEIIRKRDPNPAEDEQLKKALDILKDTSLYQANIGLAEKEGRSNKKENEKQENEKTSTSKDKEKSKK